MRLTSIEPAKKPNQEQYTFLLTFTVGDEDIKITVKPWSLLVFDDVRAVLLAASGRVVRCDPDRWRARVIELLDEYWDRKEKGTVKPAEKTEKITPVYKTGYELLFPDGNTDQSVS